MICEGGWIKFIFEDDGLCLLLIREVEYVDWGCYKCVVSNLVGKV